MKEYQTKWSSITYPEELSTDEKLAEWKEKNCQNGYHLFDEVGSLEHYLHCDACGLMVHIAHVETSEEACKRIENENLLEETPWIILERNKLKTTFLVQFTIYEYNSGNGQNGFKKFQEEFDTKDEAVKFATKIIGLIGNDKSRNFAGDYVWDGIIKSLDGVYERAIINEKINFK